MSYVNVYTYAMMYVVVLYANISCSAIAKSSFVDYIKGGCELNLIVAIDFTVRSDIMSNVCVNIVIGFQW